MKKPQVGLGVIVINNGRVLVGERKSRLGKGQWQFPGGRLEPGESFEDCAYREIREEVGDEFKVKLIDKNPVAVTNDIFGKNEHWITLYFRAKYISGEPRVMEPDKCLWWKWFYWDNLINNFSPFLFLPIQNLIKQRHNPFYEFYEKLK